MKKKYDLKDRLPGYSLADMYCLDEALRLGMSKTEFDEHKKYWNMSQALLKLLILKELKEINERML